MSIYRGSNNGEKISVDDNNILMDSTCILIVYIEVARCGVYNRSFIEQFNRVAGLFTVLSSSGDGR